MKMLAWLIGLCMCETAIALNAADANQILSFKMSEEHISMQKADPFDNLRIYPGFAVGVEIGGKTSDGHISFVVRRRHSQYDDQFTTYVKTLEVSELQNAFLAQGNVALAKNAHRRIDENGDTRLQQLLLAVSVEDAKKMTQAYLDYVTERYGKWRARQEKGIEGIRNRRARYETQLPVLIAEANGLEAEYDALDDFIPYHSDEETLNAIASLNAMLNTISVEMSGIRSKIGAIQAYQADKRVNASVQIHLEDMLIEQSIALKAAQARQETATVLRDQARRYNTLKTSIPKLRTKIKDMKLSIPHDKARLERDEREIREVIPPHVVDNVATIYPIRYKSSLPDLAEVKKD